MATISNTPRPGYVWDATDNVWYPIGVGGHGHPDYITQATAVNPTIIDAKGDIITATAADTPARLAVGNNGESLVADSSTSTGLRYTAGNPIPNPILNSAFQIWQRGTSFTGLTASQATADRWYINPGVSGGSGAVTRQTTSDTTNLPNIQYCARVQRTASNTSTNTIYLANSFETINSIPYAGKTVTLSFYARKGANFSGTGLAAGIYTGTGTDQNLITTGYTGSAASVVDNVTLTTTWQRFTITGAIPAATTEIAPTLYYTPVGTAGAADYFEVTGVQVDIGSVALPFRTNGATIQGELAACQYYFNRLAGEGNSQQISNGQCWSSTEAMATVNYPIMRVAPTITYSTNSFFSLQNATNTEVAITALASYSIRKTSYKPNMTVASGLVAGNATLFQTRSTGTVGTLDLSAEL